MGLGLVARTLVALVFTVGVAALLALFVSLFVSTHRGLVSDGGGTARPASRGS
jgi:hypothetical protein